MGRESVMISVRTQEGHHEVAAHPIEGGLAVHLATGLVGRQKCYRITHVDSGEAVPGYFRRRKDAVAAMRRILLVTDWTKPREDLSSGIRKPVLAIIHEYRRVEISVVDSEVVAI